MEGIVKALQSIANAILLTVLPEATHYIGATGEPAFQNNWVNYSASFKPCGFYRDPNGIVHLTGLAKSGTISNPIFTLPAGYRPLDSEIYAVNSTGAFGSVYIYNNGDVTPIVGTNGFISLDGISFRAEV